MKSYLYHLQINIDWKNVEFYKRLMKFMGWEVIFEEETVCGFKSERGGDVWFVKAENDRVNNYDSFGMNHVCFRVDKMTDVDVIKSFLKTDKVEMLFGTPKHRAEFSKSESETYYQIMFESPDDILFEIVYIGPKRTQIEKLVESHNFDTSEILGEDHQQSPKSD